MHFTQKNDIILLDAHKVEFFISIMKSQVIKNIGISLVGILRRNNFLAVALSLFIIGIAFLLIVQYEKEITTLQKQWLPSDNQGDGWKNLGRKLVFKNQPADLTRYNIKANFMTSGNMKRGTFEIQFCDKYSLFLTGEVIPQSGVYYLTDNSEKKYFSTVDYLKIISRKKGAFRRLKNFNLSLGCDLIEKTAGIYINDKFMEKVYLGPETMHYAVRLRINSPDTLLLDKLQISDQKGKVLFNGDYALLSFYKLISQILLFLGICIFLAVACLESHFLKRPLYFITILLLIEVFLRIAEKYDQNFDIRQLRPKWQFEISTNLYGTYNNVKEITIRNYQQIRPKTYPIAKPEHGRRIICIGSSPLTVVGSPNITSKAFPALLEKKINPKGGMRNKVININSISTYLNSPEPNIYLKEVLFKLNPDLVIFYFDWTPLWLENSKEYIEENYILYNRAKKIIEGNSRWIKNDRLLYAALEFKKPVKEIVYLYNFLCKSYLFMGLENTRKRVFSKLYYISQKPSVEKYESYFEETLRLCREKKIKILLIPQFSFFSFQINSRTKEEFTRVHNENPDIYYLDLEDAFRRNKNFPLAVDNTHPTEYGHMIIAEEIFRKLTQEGLININ